MEEPTALTHAAHRTQIDTAHAIPDIDHILAGQLAASSIAMYKRDVQAYVDYTSAKTLHWLEPHTNLPSAVKYTRLRRS